MNDRLNDYSYDYLAELHERDKALSVDESKPYPKLIARSTIFFQCPTCVDAMVEPGDYFCHGCGQRLKWSDEK